MGFAAMDLFISPAKGAKIPFNRPDKHVNGAFLLFTGMAAYGTVDADSGHDPVLFGNFSSVHKTTFTDGSFRSAS